MGREDEFLIGSVSKKPWFEKVALCCSCFQSVRLNKGLQLHWGKPTKLFSFNSVWNWQPPPHLSPPPAYRCCGEEREIPSQSALPVMNIWIRGGRTCTRVCEVGGFSSWQVRWNESNGRGFVLPGLSPLRQWGEHGGRDDPEKSGTISNIARNCLQLLAQVLQHQKHTSYFWFIVEKRENDNEESSSCWILQFGAWMWQSSCRGECAVLVGDCAQRNCGWFSKLVWRRRVTKEHLTLSFE